MAAIDAVDALRHDLKRFFSDKFVDDYKTLLNHTFFTEPTQVNIHGYMDRFEFYVVGSIVVKALQKDNPDIDVKYNDLDIVAPKYGDMETLGEKLIAEGYHLTPVMMEEPSMICPDSERDHNWRYEKYIKGDLKIDVLGGACARVKDIVSDFDFSCLFTYFDGKDIYIHNRIYKMNPVVATDKRWAFRLNYTGVYDPTDTTLKKTEIPYGWDADDLGDYRKYTRTAPYKQWRLRYRERLLKYRTRGFKVIEADEGEDTNVFCKAPGDKWVLYNQSEVAPKLSSPL